MATILFVNAFVLTIDPGSWYIDFSQSLFALIASGIVSILIVIIPSGLGVREATLAALLTGLLTFEIATVVSILMRLSVIISELMGLSLLPYLIKNHSTSGKSL